MSCKSIIEIFRGDDSDALGYQSITCTITTNLDLSDCTVTFRYLNFSVDYTNVESDVPFDIVIPKASSAAFPPGFGYASLKVTDADGKLRTFDNRIPVLVKTSTGGCGQIGGEFKVDFSKMAYSDIIGKPQINGVTLEGNKTEEELGLQGEIIDLDEIRSGAAKGATSVQTVNNIAPDANGNVNVSITADDTLTASSQNPVKSSGIWAHIWGALTAIPDSMSSLYDWITTSFMSRKSGKHGTQAGCVTDYIISGSIGGVRLRMSSQNENTLTSYEHDGITRRINNVDDKYYFDDSNANGIARKKDIPAAVTVDDALSGTSTNPVQNKVVTAALSGITAADIVEFLGKSVFGTYKGEWNDSTAYSIGDIVLFSGKYYRAIENLPAGEPSPTTYGLSWGQGSGISPYPYTESAGVMKLLALFSASGTAGQFNALLASLLANYLPLSGGDMTGDVSFGTNGGVLNGGTRGIPSLWYKATGVRFDALVALRTLVSNSAYSATASYSVGNIVWYDPAGDGFVDIYRCIAATTGNAPTNTAYWKRITLADFLPLTGGTLTGGLTIDTGDVQENSSLCLGNNNGSPGKMYLNPYGVSDASGYYGGSGTGALWSNIITTANGNNSAYALTTDIPSASSSNPSMDGTASVGSSSSGYACGDHVHPTDTTRLAATAGAPAWNSAVAYKFGDVVYHNGKMWRSIVWYDNLDEEPSATATVEWEDVTASSISQYKQYLLDETQIASGDPITLAPNFLIRVDLSSYGASDSFTLELPKSAFSGTIKDAVVIIVTGSAAPEIATDAGSSGVFIANDDSWATLEASSYNVLTFTSTGVAGEWIVGRVTTAISA